MRTSAPRSRRRARAPIRRPDVLPSDGVQVVSDDQRRRSWQKVFETFNPNGPPPASQTAGRVLLRAACIRLASAPTTSIISACSQRRHALFTADGGATWSRTSRRLDAPAGATRRLSGGLQLVARVRRQQDDVHRQRSARRRRPFESSSRLMAAIPSPPRTARARPAAERSDQQADRQPARSGW